MTKLKCKLCHKLREKTFECRYHDNKVYVLCGNCMWDNLNYFIPLKIHSKNIPSKPSKIKDLKIRLKML